MSDRCPDRSFSSAASPALYAPTVLSALQERGRLPVPGAGCDGFKYSHEGGLAVVVCPHLANGLLPIGRESGAQVAFAGPLEVRSGGLVVLAFPGVDDAHRLSAPQASGQFGMRLLQLQCGGLGGGVTGG